MSKASERRIVLGVDDTASSLAALQWAVSQARSREAQLVAVRSWALGLPRHGGRHDQPRDVAVTVRTPEGDLGAALTSIATRNGDVIVVGRENMPDWRRARHGSVTRYCRSHVGCPVVVVPTEQEWL